MRFVPLSVCRIGCRQIAQSGISMTLTNLETGPTRFLEMRLKSYSCLSVAASKLRQDSHCFLQRPSLSHNIMENGNGIATSQASVPTESRPEVELDFLSGTLEGVAVIGFNRAKARNAISKRMLTEFGEALEHVRFDNNLRVLILRSLVPGIFCAGADLKERAQMPPHEVGPFVARLRGLLTGVAQFPAPVIAALDGAALGGGLELALGCDIRIAADSARLGLTETKLAIIPGGGGTQNLPRLVGPAIAKELIFTGRAVVGSEAATLGLVNRSVPQNEDGDAAYHASLDLAAEIVTQGPIALRMAKAAINRGLSVDLQSGLAFEEACYAQVIPTRDRLEGLAAFKEKRPPKYTGQ